MKDSLRRAVQVVKAAARSEAIAILLAAVLPTIFYYVPMVRIAKTELSIHQAQAGGPGNVQSPRTPRAPSGWVSPQLGSSPPSVNLRHSYREALEQADEDFHNNAAQAYRDYERLFVSLPESLKHQINAQNVEARKNYNRAAYDEAARSMHDSLHVALANFGEN